MANRNEKTLLEWALEYYSRGWSIIPIGANKKPPKRFSWKQYQEKRPDEKQIRKWFSNGNKNIAVILGEVSRGLVCRDFDTMAEYEKWVKQFPNLAKMLPTVQTARGMHVYFEGHFEGIKHISNGELRGSGVYCLLPPSVHPSGKIYEWNIPLNGKVPEVEPKVFGVPDYTLHTLQTLQTKQCCVISNKIEAKKVIEKNRAFIEDCIKQALPENFGQRNREIFFFALKLKFNEQLRNVDPRELLEVVKQWYNQALPNIRTKDFLETWNDFLVAWKNISFYGVDYMKACETSLNLKPSKYIAENYGQYKDLTTLEAFCRVLDKTCNGKGFVLDCRTAGTIIGICHKTANTYLRLLCNIGILELLERGRFSDDPKKRKANKYKYIFEN